MAGPLEKMEENSAKMFLCKMVREVGGFQEKYRFS